MTLLDTHIEISGPDEQVVTDAVTKMWESENKWGEQNYDIFTHLAIVGEELGEVQQAALQARFENGEYALIRHEAVQLAAMALSLLKRIDRDYDLFDPRRKTL